MANGGDLRTRIHPISLIILAVCIIVIIVVVYWCWGKCDSNIEGDATAVSKLIIEDDHAAVWMPIDNAFTGVTVDEPERKRVGILFQLGEFWRYTDTGLEQSVHKSGTVVFDAEGASSVTLTPSEYDWINIVGAHPDKEGDPITLEFAQILYPNDVETDCSVVDACARAYDPPASPACGDALNTIRRTCVRGRSLHAYFKPTGIITYWQGKKGFDMTGRQIKRGGRENQIELKLRDKVTVFVWLNGSPNTVEQNKIAALGDVLEIRLPGPSELTHNENHGPPTNGNRRP